MLLLNLDLSVQFDPVDYSVMEGQPVSFRVVLNIAASFDVMVSFTTSDSTAIGAQEKHPFFTTTTYFHSSPL